MTFIWFDLFAFHSFRWEIIQIDGNEKIQISVFFTFVTIWHLRHVITFEAQTVNPFYSRDCCRRGNENEKSRWIFIVCDVL